MEESKTLERMLHSNDARAWAAGFEKCKKENGWTIEDIDENLMIGWFANAMSAQETADRKIIDGLESKLEEVKSLAKKMVERTSFW